jgi:O-methyltransferase involved in polyketide biosynthesis
MTSSPFRDSRHTRRGGTAPAAERLFEDPYAALFAAAGAHAKKGTERFLALPFFGDAVRLRTRYVDNAVIDGLWEGVIGYITVTAVERTLRLVAGACGPSGRLVFTHGEGAFVGGTAVESSLAAGFRACEESIDVVWRRYLVGDPPPALSIAKVATARR